MPVWGRVRVFPDARASLQASIRHTSSAQRTAVVRLNESGLGRCTAKSRGPFWPLKKSADNYSALLTPRRPSTLMPQRTQMGTAAVRRQGFINAVVLALAGDCQGCRTCVAVTVENDRPPVTLGDRRHALVSALICGMGSNPYALGGGAPGKGMATGSQLRRPPGSGDPENHAGRLGRRRSTAGWQPAIVILGPRPLLAAPDRTRQESSADASAVDLARR